MLPVMLNLQGVAASIPITIKGEAYNINLAPKFPVEGFNGLDFGTVRVVDDKSLPIVLKNTEKYQVSFNFALRTASARELFTIVPEQGVVDPGKDVTVQVGAGMLTLGAFCMPHTAVAPVLWSCWPACTAAVGAVCVLMYACAQTAHNSSSSRNSEAAVAKLQMLCVSFNAHILT